MAASLPPAQRLKLDQTLAQWPHWQGEGRPRRPLQLLEMLGGGLSNHSALVAETEAAAVRPAPPARRYVVRVDGVNPAAVGLNRQAEWQALKTASAARLAPTPRYFNPDLGSLVCDYLPPDPTPPEPGSPAELAAIATALRAIHRLPAVHSRLDLRERMQRYLRLLQRRGEATGARWQAARERITGLLEIDGPAQRVLCHNDLLSGNRLWSGGRLWALDWEYCGMGSPWFDLAVVAAGEQLDRDQRAGLLGAYLERGPTPLETRALAGQCCVYLCLEALWFRAVRGESGDDAEARLARLEVELAKLDSASG